MPRPIKTPDEALVAAVSARPGATAAEVADDLSIGQSTAQKRLAALEAQGAVRRSPGGRVDGVRVPDRWHAADRHGDVDAVDPVPPADAPTGDGSPEIDAADGDLPAAPGSRRLGRGALVELVRGYLAERPGESFGPAGIGKALGRSGGAVSNALAAMAGRGEAILVAERPRRYRIAR